MTATYTALTPAQVRRLALATRELRRALVSLRDEDGTPQVLDLFADPVAKSEDLRKVFRAIDQHQATVRRLSGAGNEPAIEFGLFGERGKLEGIRAHQFLAHIESLKLLLDELYKRWGLAEFTGPDDGLDLGRMVAAADRLARPKCSSGDLARVETALATLDLPGAVTDLREKMSNIPPPIRRGAGSWEIPGTSPYLPGEKVESEDGQPDLVRVVGESQDQWLDISKCRNWPLDQPYAITRANGSEPDGRLRFTRFPDDASWIGKRRMGISLRSSHGRRTILHSWDSFKPVVSKRISEPRWNS